MVPLSVARRIRIGKFALQAVRVDLSLEIDLKWGAPERRNRSVKISCPDYRAELGCPRFKDFTEYWQ